MAYYLRIIILFLCKPIFQWTSPKFPLAGSYGQGALSYAETFFRKKDAITEKDMESLIEDLEDLNLLDKSGKKG
ncbi:MAG: hypothetical protein KJP23_31540 [Deltaproteobacteria bacterium]|nr:hypothetical protein [Deltaproteobacteria bacterium]